MEKKFSLNTLFESAFQNLKTSEKKTKIKKPIGPILQLFN